MPALQRAVHRAVTRCPKPAAAALASSRAAEWALALSGRWLTFDGNSTYDSVQRRSSAALSTAVAGRTGMPSGG